MKFRDMCIGWALGFSIMALAHSLGHPKFGWVGAIASFAVPFILSFGVEEK